MAFAPNPGVSYSFSRKDFENKIDYELSAHKFPWKFWVSRATQEKEWLREKLIAAQMKIMQLEADVFTQRALVGQYANAEATRNRELSKKSIR